MLSAIIERIRYIIQFIDLRALSGLTRMLGVEFDEEDQIRVTQLARKGMPLGKLSARFEVLTSLCVGRAQGEAPELVGGRLALALQGALVTTRAAVVGIPRQRLRSVEAQIPQSVRDQESWIAEHAAELLKLPVTGEEFAFRSVRVRREGTSDHVRITFVRNSELDSVRQVLAFAGLEPHALLSPSELDASPFRQLAPQETDPAIVVSATLAIAGFLPELIDSDYLPPREHEVVEARWAKNLFRRVALATGSILLVLLLVETVTSRLLAQRLAAIEEQHAALQFRQAEVEELDKRVTSLQARLDDRTSTLTRTNLTRMLYEVANATPGDVRLLQVHVQEEAGWNVTLRGCASGEAGVTRFLKGLAKTFPDVKLARSRVARDGADRGAHRMTGRDKWEFEMRVSRRSETG